MPTQQPRYEVYKTEGQYYAYDRHQDIFVDRFKNPVSCGFFTKSEARSTVRHLNKTS
ncbi:MAG: hypothetical protein PHU14_01610 [Methylovulum sp.]|nr:hypothetical protein [Methylovulum sp.]